jgi:hypothetical protein
MGMPPQSAAHVCTAPTIVRRLASPYQYMIFILLYIVIVRRLVAACGPQPRTGVRRLASPYPPQNVKQCVADFQAANPDVSILIAVSHSGACAQPPIPSKKKER